MNTFAAGLSTHPDAATATAEAVASVAETVAQRDVVIVSIAEPFSDQAPQIDRAVRELLAPNICLSYVTGSVLGGGIEAEQQSGISIFAANLDHVAITPFALQTVETPDGAGIVGMLDEFVSANTAILLADPFTTPAEALVKQLGLEFPQMQVAGGLVTGSSSPAPAWLSINGDVYEQGAIGIAFEGLDTTVIVSQGCRPIGDPFVVTNAEANLITELGGRPALDRLLELAEHVSQEEREMLTHGLHVGLVIDEHQSEFRRGDFLVRAVLGADQERKAVAIGDYAHIGQTVQFQVRDATSADEDLRLALSDIDPASGALMFTCNGRGNSLFGYPHHDVSTIQELLGPLPLSGAFCAGEIGPVAGTPFVHGFTAVVAAFHG